MSGEGLLYRRASGDHYVVDVATLHAEPAIGSAALPVFVPGIAGGSAHMLNSFAITGGSLAPLELSSFSDGSFFPGQDVGSNPLLILYYRFDELTQF